MLAAPVEFPVEFDEPVTVGRADWADVRVAVGTAHTASALDTAMTKHCERAADEAEALHSRADSELDDAAAWAEFIVDIVEDMG